MSESPNRKRHRQLNGDGVSMSSPAMSTRRKTSTPQAAARVPTPRHPSLQLQLRGPTTGFVWHQDMLDHRAPDKEEHPERPERVRVAHSHLSAIGLLEKCLEVPCIEVETKHLLAVHDERHINYVDSTAFYGDSNFKEYSSGELYVSQGTARAARLAAGGIVELSKRVARDELANGFALIRPPGHHCSATHASGFCFFNNVAVAARAVQKECRGIRRVAILDWDVHHCNGTESIFYDDPTALVISIHQHFHGKTHQVETKKVVDEDELMAALDSSSQSSGTSSGEEDEEALNFFRARGLDPDEESYSSEEEEKTDLDSLTSSQVVEHQYPAGQAFYPGTGTVDRIGISGAEGTNINFPWPCVGFGDAEYMHVLQTLFLPILKEFAPDMVFISCGFDCAAGDTLGSMKVTPTGFHQMTNLVQQVCPRVVVALEGGYNTTACALGTEAVLRSLLDTTSNDDSMMLWHQCQRAIAAVKATHQGFWTCLHTP